MVTVKFSSGMSYARAKGTEFKLEWTEGTVADLLQQLEVDMREVGTVLLDGQAVKLDHQVGPNSEIYVLPILLGG